MDNIFTLGDFENFSEKINLDDLYEKKKSSDLLTLTTFNKILHRIHNKVKYISRQKKDTFCWYVVPEIMLGVPRYNNNDCIAYIITKLKNNGFIVKYTHPNMLFISWHSWIPDYVRHEIKKKTNTIIDGYGNILADNIPKIKNEKPAPNVVSNKTENIYKNINNYKPSGNTIYNNL